jgi:hypothetical protein
VNAIFNAEPYIRFGDKRQFGFGRRKLVLTLYHQLADALHWVPAPDIARWCVIA